MNAFVQVHGFVQGHMVIWCVCLCSGSRFGLELVLNINEKSEGEKKKKEKEIRQIKEILGKFTMHKDQPREVICITGW